MALYWTCECDICNITILVIANRSICEFGPTIPPKHGLRPFPSSVELAFPTSAIFNSDALFINKVG